MPLNKRSKMKRTIIFIIIIYAVLVGIIIINAFPMNISRLLLSGFSLIALLLLKRKIKTNYLEKELEKYFYNKGYIAWTHLSEKELKKHKEKEY